MRRSKWFCFRLMIFAAFTIILVINFGFIRSFVSDSLPKTIISLINQALVGISTHLNGIPKESSSYEDYVLSLERRSNCNLRTPSNCFGTKKSLVITFWSQKSRQRWFTLNLLSVFPEKYFDYMVMVHDNSSWNHHPAYEKVIWIHVKGQLRFWYIKRFLSPHTLRAYRYVWIVDDDARFYFNPRVYECVVEKFNISLSAPARGEGFIIHRITKLHPNYATQIGRWTDFVEIGPIFIAKASVWICLWTHLSEKVGLGYGLDTIWCRVLSQRCSRQSSASKICAILDAFIVHHDSTKVNTVQIGSAEIPAYIQYQNYSSAMRVFGAVAPNSTDLHLCTSQLTKDQS